MKIRKTRQVMEGKKRKESCWLPVVMMADFIAAGDQFGWKDFT